MYNDLKSQPTLKKICEIKNSAYTYDIKSLTHNLREGKPVMTVRRDGF